MVSNVVFCVHILKCWAKIAETFEFWYKKKQFGVCPVVKGSGFSLEYDKYIWFGYLDTYTQSAEKDNYNTIPSAVNVVDTIKDR